MDDDLYVLPSSVHEVIVVPASLSAAGDLGEMVRSVNKEVVSEIEYLSDHPYYYSRERKEMLVA